MGIKSWSRSITIRETPAGWLNSHTGRTHKSAALAEKAVDRDTKKIIDSGVFGAVITEVVWEPTTRAGRIVVAAITS